MVSNFSQSFESYDDKLREISKTTPNFGGIHKDLNGDLVVSIKNDSEIFSNESQSNYFKSYETKKRYEKYNTIDEAKSKLGDELYGNLEKLLGKERLNYKKKFRVEKGAFGVAFTVEYEEKIVMREVNYSYSELYDWYQIIREDIFKFNGIVGADIDEIENKISIYIDNSSNESLKWNIKSLFSSNNIPMYALTFLESKPVITNVSLRDRSTSMRGGLQIFRRAGSIIHFCTAGFVTQINGIRGFLTNAHCTSSQGIVNDGTIFEQGTYSDSVILGSPALESASTGICSSKICYNTDAAFIPLPDSMPSSEYVLKSKYLNARELEIKTGSNSIWTSLYFPEDINLGDRAAVIAGDAAFKTGRTTGTTSGIVTRVCIDVNVGLSNRYICQMEVEGDSGRFSDSGDSGSPVLGSILGRESWAYTYPYSNRARALGLNWGSTSDGQFAYFTSIDAIRQELGDFDSI